MWTRKKITYLLIAIFLVAALISGCAKKEAAAVSKYPDKPVDMIIAFTAGGSSDVQARIVEKYWKQEFGNTMVFQYKVGAGGQVGFTELAKARTDGYTVGGVNYPHIVLQALSPQATFSKDDFVAIAQVVNDPQIIAVRKESSIKSLNELLAAAKANEGKLTLGIVGTYSGHHVAALKFMDLTGTKYSLVTFQGAADQNIALLGGHIDVMVGNLNDVMRDIDKFTILGIAADKRHPYIKDVPTFKEQNINFVADIRRGFSVPKNTDPLVVKRLRDGFAKIAVNKEYLADMEKIGQPSEYLSGEEFQKYIDNYHNDAKAILEKYGLLKK
ncbi:tripartite tricarboxylate transporter substrate binding protein [Anaerospora hongkongensis]|uniref:tripartite tricarboxylate transporter substrate binding protein n=1 Tax=Anaerospora hongkongensis TaxID=244830 RepID=UPI0028A2125D|nr:tripartite tricarboxylate transporter substrate binding protein [Anaerospora hongkongensis]